ncbi:MAG: LacI family DNA-binding transcriptional regulator [Anaerolineaceae bacterium]|nr:LacI family DNA-binding transcriptional regulator [Anaerolineaceae bacterium]
MVDLTLEDIALQAGVSRSTVSRVLNHQPNVSQDIRQRVMDVIEVTGFQPNAAARSLASHRSWTIGLVLPKGVGAFFSDPYFPRLTQGIAQACNMYEYTLGLFIVNSVEDEEKIYPRISRKGLLDGILVQAGSTGDHLVERLIQNEMPIVALGRPINQCCVNYIDIDNYGSSRIAVEHLVKLGKKRIATITGPQESMAGRERMRGYIEVLGDNGFELDEKLIAYGDFTQASGYSLIRDLLPAKPDALFAGSDSIAYGALQAINEVGLKVPEDIAVVGFDDLTGPNTSLSKHQLTTIHQPVFQFGMSAVELLIDVIENGMTPVRELIVNTELIVRETCGAPKDNES